MFASPMFVAADGGWIKEALMGSLARSVQDVSHGCGPRPGCSNILREIFSSEEILTYKFCLMLRNFG